MLDLDYLPHVTARVRQQAHQGEGKGEDKGGGKGKDLLICLLLLLLLHLLFLLLSLHLWFLILAMSDTKHDALRVQHHAQQGGHRGGDYIMSRSAHLLLLSPNSSPCPLSPLPSPLVPPHTQHREQHITGYDNMHNKEEEKLPYHLLSPDSSLSTASSFCCHARSSFFRRTLVVHCSR